MSVPRIIGFVFLLGGLVFAVVLARDFSNNRESLRSAPGDLKLLLVLEFVIYFLSTMGISAFLLNTPIIKRFRLADDKSIPSCLIASGMVPGAIIAFSYLQAENSSDTLTLLCFMAGLAVGGVIGGRAVSRLNGAAIRKLMSFALLFSMVMLIVKMIISAGAAGTAVGLRGFRLAIAAAASIGIGFLSMMGVPSKPIATAMLLLGLSPVAALTLTLVLGAIIPLSGGPAIIRAGRYNRKMVLAGMTAGSAASVLGVMLAISMNAMLLNILLLFFTLVAVISVFKK